MAATPLAWVALVPLFLAFLRATAHVAAAAGLVFGAVATLGIGWWLPGTLERFFEVPVTLAWFGFALAGILIDGLPYAALGAFVAWRARRTQRAPVLALGAGFVLAEWLRASGPVANPYALLAYSQHGSAFAQLADLVGPFGVGWLIASANAALATLCVASPRARALRGALATAALVAAAWLYGVARLDEELPAEGSLRVAVVQTGIARDRHGNEAARAERLARTLALTRAANAERPDLVFWPEHAVDFYLSEPTPERAALFQALGDLDVELVLGAPDLVATADGPRFTNSVFLLDGRGLRAKSDKVRLVPFAEYGPFGAGLRADTALFEPGAQARLPARAAAVGAFLCGESLYPEVVRALVASGAELLANPSIDTWLQQPAAALSLVQVAAFRAIENRRFVVRATPTGYSAVIDPYGRVTALSRFGGAELLHATVSRSRRETVYQRVGNAACGAALLAVAALSLEAGRSGRRRRPFA